MKNRLFINLLLLVAIAALFFYLNKSEVQTAYKHTMSSIEAAAINTIVIDRHNRESIQLVKKKIGWQIIQPINAKANDVRISLILDILSSDSQSSFTPTSSNDLSQFGLDPASISLTLNKEQFQFGNIEALNKLRYIEHNGVIHLVKDTLAPLLNASAASFIDNRIIATGLQISSLELPLESNSHKFIMSLANGHWTSNNTKLSSDDLVELASSWQQAYAMQVVPINNQKVSGRKVVINYTDASSSEFILGQSDSNLSLVNLETGLNYLFPAATKHQLLAPIESD